MTRRQFSRELKREAVHLVVGRGVSFAQPAKDVDVHQTVLRRRVKQYRDRPDTAFPGKGQLAPVDDEVRRLRREVARLKAERDILKMAVAYFAKDQLGFSGLSRSTGGSELPAVDGRSRYHMLDEPLGQLLGVQARS